jgi:hypothetical protein
MAASVCRALGLGYSMDSITQTIRTEAPVLNLFDALYLEDSVSTLLRVQNSRIIGAHYDASQDPSSQEPPSTSSWGGETGPVGD